MPDELHERPGRDLIRICKDKQWSLHFSISPIVILSTFALKTWHSRHTRQQASHFCQAGCSHLRKSSGVVTRTVYMLKSRQAMNSLKIRKISGSFICTSNGFTALTFDSPLNRCMNFRREAPQLGGFSGNSGRAQVGGSHAFRAFQSARGCAAPVDHGRLDRGQRLGLSERFRVDGFLFRPVWPPLRGGSSRGVAVHVKPEMDARRLKQEPPIPSIFLSGQIEPHYSFQNMYNGSQKSDPCFHKKYMEAGVMTFVAHCT